jgi:hypothetical protein
MVRKALSTIAALLVGFHVWLFARDAWTGGLVDLGLLARWAAAAGLLWGLVALRRQGVSLVRSRQAVAIWVLAALLHGPAIAGPIEIADLPAAPVVAAALVPAVALAGLLVLLALAGAFRARSVAVAGVRVRSNRPCPGPLTPGSHLPFSQRPPPVIS